MKKIITALGTPNLNNELRKINQYEIITKDIQYQEGLLEIIENRKDIEILILSELLNGEMNVKELVNEIKNKNPLINIIMFLEKENQELKNFLISKGIFKIYINNQVEIKEIINVINNIEININEELTEEIKKLKEIIISNNLKVEKINRKSRIFNKIKNEIIKEKNEKLRKQVICVTGGYGTGKSIFSSNLGNYLKNDKIKTLIIDFDIFNNSINTIFGVKKYPINYTSKNIEIKDLIIKINKNLNLLCGIDLLFNNENKIQENKIKELFNKLKENYDVIIIDTSSETYFKYSKLIINNSDKIIFLVEPNVLEIKKSKSLLKIYIEEWNIAKEKINIILNKINVNSIDEQIIKNIFSEVKILGKIKFNTNYNLLVNKNMNDLISIKNNEKEYKNIKNKLIYSIN